MAVVVNKPIPEFEALATSGIKVSNQTHLGQTVVLYFYPKDGTPVCTKEAIEFSDHEDEFAEILNANVGKKLAVLPALMLLKLFLLTGTLCP